jgi:hypothetical protein
MLNRFYVLSGKQLQYYVIMLNGRKRPIIKLMLHATMHHTCHILAAYKPVIMATAAIMCYTTISSVWHNILWVTSEFGIMPVEVSIYWRFFCARPAPILPTYSANTLNTSHNPLLEYYLLCLCYPYNTPHNTQYALMIDIAMYYDGRLSIGVAGWLRKGKGRLFLNLALFLESSQSILYP